MILFDCKRPRIENVKIPFWVRYYTVHSNGEGWTDPSLVSHICGTEPEFVNLLKSPGKDSQPGGIDSMKSVPGLLKRFQIWALVVYTCTAFLNFWRSCRLRGPSNVSSPPSSSLLVELEVKNIGFLIKTSQRSTGCFVAHSKFSK